jgi:hypothetical protein
VNRATVGAVVPGMTHTALRVLAAIALGISAYVHLHLASRFGYPGTINGTTLFRIQGVTAAVVAVALLASGNQWVWVAAALVGLASFVAVVLYQYVDVGAIGPLPNMYDPYWSTEKALSAVAEIAVPILWLTRLSVRRSSTLPAHRRFVAPQQGGS